jgi:hypothetical protein
MKLTHLFGVILSTALSNTALSTANAHETPVIPDHFHDRYGSNNDNGQSSKKAKPGKLEQLFKEGTVLSRQSERGDLSIKIKRKSIGIEWEREF